MEEFSSNNYDPFEDQPATTTADEDFEDAVKNLVRKRPLVLVTVGKAGAGKSTLINNFLRLRGNKVAKSKASPEFGTKGIDCYEQEVHGIVVRIIDTPGLEANHRSSKEEQEELATLSVITDGKADVMLYCMKLSDRDDGKDERIVQKLTKAFGKEIWRHTVLVLTYGDAVLNQDEGDRDILERFTRKFKEFVKKARVRNVPVKPILSAQDKQPEIIGIPVGKRTESPQDWRDLLFKEIIKKCRIDSIPAMLVLQGMTPDWIEAVLALGAGAGLLGAGGAGMVAGATTGVSAGSVVGGVVGGAVGAVFGGVGSIPGAALGAKIGGVIGGLTGGAAGSVGGLMAGSVAAGGTIIATETLSNKLFSYVAIIRARKRVEELEEKKASEKEEMKAIEEKANVQEVATSEKEGNEKEKATEAEESTNEKEMASEEK